MDKLTDEESVEFKRLWDKACESEQICASPVPLRITCPLMYGIWDSHHEGWMLRSANDPQLFMDVRKGVCIAQLKAWDLRNADVREIGPDGLPVEEKVFSYPSEPFTNDPISGSQTLHDWRDRAITAENRLASAGMTSSWNGHECAMLKQDAALGRQVRKMPEESRLCRQCGGGWVYDHMGNDSSAMAMPEFALDQGGVTP